MVLGEKSCKQISSIAIMLYIVGRNNKYSNPGLAGPPQMVYIYTIIIILY